VYEKEQNQDSEFRKFLADQIVLSRSEWSPEFKKYVADKIEERKKFEEETIELTPKQEQEKVYSRYLKSLDLSEDDLKGKKIIDLGSGESEFVSQIIDRNISDDVYGIDVKPDTSNLDEKHKKYILQGNFQEKLPVGGADYVISVGAVTNGIWGGEDNMDMENVLKNALDAIRDDGELRIWPIIQVSPDYTGFTG
jgi:hypothetical protein